MARNASVDNTAVERLTTHWADAFKNDYQDTIYRISDNMQKLKKHAKKEIEELQQTKYISYKVAPIILDLLKKDKSNEALRQLHIASYKVQEVSASFKTIYNPKAIEYLNDSNIILNDAYNRFSTDTSVNQLLGSNAAIDRYYRSIASELEAQQNYINTDKKVIDELSKFIEEQLYALSRLDGVIRYHNSLNVADSMNSANKGVVVQ